MGKYGPYLEGPGDDGTPAAKKANVPDDLPPDELTLEKAKELLANPAGEEIPLGNHPETGLEVVAKNGRYGPFVTELLPEDAPKKARPRTGSLFKDMSLDTINLDQAVKLLSLPRVVGVDSEGEEITAQNGRYGPYLKKRHRLALAGDRAAALRHHPRPGPGDLRPAQAARSRAAATAPLKELGNDPVSGAPVVVKAGRFGEYVTDGEYNATLRKDDSVEAITLERAAELLAERRAKGPAKKAAKRGAKKSTAKKSARRRPRRRPRRPRRRAEPASGVSCAPAPRSTGRRIGVRRPSHDSALAGSRPRVTHVLRTSGRRRSSTTGEASPPPSRVTPCPIGSPASTPRRGVVRLLRGRRGGRQVDAGAAAAASGSRPTGTSWS